MRIAPVIFAILLLATNNAHSDAQTVRLFAAASTAPPVKEIISLIKVADGPKTVPVFAASGALARQIEYGAPADLYLAAHPIWMDHLASKKLLKVGSRRDLIGNCLIVARPITTSPLPQLSQRFVTHLAESRIALGDPVYVPVGQYAAEALKNLGIWSGVERLSARLPSARHVQLLLERQEVLAGFLYRSDARANARIAINQLVDPAMHAEIVYPIAIIQTPNVSKNVKTVFEFFLSDQGVQVFSRYGFRRLGEKC